MANEYYISAGIVPIDNSSGATENSYYISAGIIPDDTGAPAGPPEFWPEQLGLDPMGEIY